jgi:hypothetical protein
VSDSENSKCATCGHPRNGKTQKHRHAYILFAVGDTPEGQIEDINGLAWPAIFEHLYTSYAGNPDAVYVGFFLSYDFAQILRGIPVNRASALFAERETTFKFPDGTEKTYSGISSRKRSNSGGNTVPFPVELRTGQDVTPEFTALTEKARNLSKSASVQVPESLLSSEKRWQIDILLPTRRLKLRPKICTCVNQSCDHMKNIPWMYCVRCRTIFSVIISERD